MKQVRTFTGMLMLFLSISIGLSCRKTPVADQEQLEQTTKSKNNMLSATNFAIDPSATFHTGGDVYDTNGNIVHAVEGGIIKVGNLFYLWGMDRSDNNYTFKGVNIYSSPDLKNWTFINSILKNASHPDLASGSVVERPKLLHNTATGQFVLWVHYEGWGAYGTAEVGYATSSTIGGNYSWQGHFRPLGLDSRDMNVFKDTDGKAYMISSVSVNSEVAITELNSSYTGHTRIVYRGSDLGCEGHALFKLGGTYFLVESKCSSWDTNDNHYYTATSLSGPWTYRGLIAPDNARTYQSQVTNAFQVIGSNRVTWVYLGDRWSTWDMASTRLVILPFNVSGTTLSLPWYDQWSVNTTTGNVSALPQVNFEGQVKIINRKSGRAMEVGDWLQSDNASIKQFDYSGGNNQRWTISNLGRGEFRIVNVHSGKSLEVPNLSRNVGTTATQYTWNNGFNQKWHILPCKGGYFRFVNTNTLGKTLSIRDASTANSADVVINEFHFQDDAQWQILPATN